MKLYRLLEESAEKNPGGTNRLRSVRIGMTLFWLGAMIAVVACAPSGNLPILTGDKTANYYKAAKELNTVMTDAHALRIMESPGSYRNIKALAEGRAKLAIAQFDVLYLYSLRKSLRPFVNKSSLLAPGALEHVHVIVRRDSDIKSLKGLHTKQLAVGPQFSGSWISAYVLMYDINEFDMSKKKNIHYLSYKDALKALKRKQVDAFFITSPMGVPFLKKLPASFGEDFRLLPVEPELKLTNTAVDFYTRQVLPARIYPWQKKAVTTFATPSYILISNDVAGSDAAAITKDIYEDAEKLHRTGHLWHLMTKRYVKSELALGRPYHAAVREYLGVKEEKRMLPPTDN